MAEILHINWDTGYANVYLKAFFPCTKAKYKELLRIIHLDWNYESELIKALHEFFTLSISEKEDEYKSKARDFRYYNQKEADMRNILADRKYSNGLPLSKGQEKNIKEYKKKYNALKREAKQAALQAKKDKEWFEKMASQLAADEGRYLIEGS